MPLFRVLYQPKAIQKLNGKEGWKVEEETTLRSRRLREGRYIFASRYVRGRRVLEVGCGIGVGSARLRSAGASAVVASDIDPSALRYGRERNCDEELRAMLALHFTDVTLFGYYPFTLRRRVLETTIALIEPLLSYSPFLKGCAVRLINQIFYSSMLRAGMPTLDPKYEAQPFDQKMSPYTLLAVSRAGRNCPQT
jgi:SAM-dependent methyltransferase